MSTVTLKRPLPTQSPHGEGPTLPAGTKITITGEWRGFPYNRHLQVIRAAGQEHVVYDHDLADAQKQP